MINFHTTLNSFYKWTKLLKWPFFGLKIMVKRGVIFFSFLIERVPSELLLPSAKDIGPERLSPFSLPWQFRYRKNFAISILEKYLWWIKITRSFCMKEALFNQKWGFYDSAYKKKLKLKQFILKQCFQINGKDITR